MLDRGSLGVTELFAAMMLAVPDHYGEGVAAEDITQIEGGVEATVLAPSGDRYRVSVQWLGDREQDEGES